MRNSQSTKNQGAALITTLLIMVILSVAILAMLSLSRDQLKTSGSQDAVVNLQSMRDSTINIAISQIREATTQSDELWASQPGAIRTFSEDGGNPEQIFKLYSSDNMVVDGDTDLADNDLVTDWDSQPGVYADLNAPKTDSEGERFFPIVDPRAFDGQTGDGSQTPEGFSYTESINGVTLPQGGDNSQRLPMPVKWIYQLRNGKLGTLNDTLTFQAFDGTSSADADNPVVGRFAFWTDDESAKININTASEAIPWDTPRCYTPEDLEYAEQQPVLNEVQRFNGHPATTCLSSVFYPGRYLDPENDQDEFEIIYKVAPRVHNDGGLMADNHERVTFDNDRLYTSVDDLLFDSEDREVQIDGLSLDRKRFFLTANSNSPEVNPAGKPKVCLWPMHWDENNNDGFRTPYDNLIQFATTLGDRPYFYQRGNQDYQQGDWTFHDIGNAGGQGSVDEGSASENQSLLEYFTRSVGFESDSVSDLSIPGYNGNFFAKYGKANMAYNSFLLFDYARTVNLMDDTKIDNQGDGSLDSRVTPWSQALQSSGAHQHHRIGTANSNLIMRNQLERSQQLSDHVEDLVLSFDLENSGSKGLHTLARRYTLNELALVFTTVVLRGSGGSDYSPPLADIDGDISTAIQDPDNPLFLEENSALLTIGFIAEMSTPGAGYPHVTPINVFSVHAVDELLINDEPPRQLNGSVWTADIDSASIDFGLPSSNITTSGYYGLWEGSAFGGTADYRLMTSGTSLANLQNTPRSAGMNAYYTATLDDGELMRVRTVNPFDIGIQQNGITAPSSRQIRGFNIPEVLVPVPMPPSEPGLQGKWIDRMNWFLEAARTDPDVDLIDENDVVRSFVSSHGDQRLGVVNGHAGFARNSSDLENWLVMHPDWSSGDSGSGTSVTTLERQIHTLYKGGSPFQISTDDQSNIMPFISAVEQAGGYADSVRPDISVIPSDDDPIYTKALPPNSTVDRINSIRTAYPYSINPEITRDWDTGPGSLRDGGYSNLPDYGTHPTGGTPYFDQEFDYTIPLASSSTTGPEITKPNHIVPSAGMFGSLPSLGPDMVPWTTFLFRPELNEPHIGAIGRSRDSSGNHPLGSRDDRSYPPDHMLLEYFWMPVIQPYLISEPFSTAGKIGMNYRMAPFDYITRATGLHAVFKSERMLAIPNSGGQQYKTDTSGQSGRGWRRQIDAEETLRQWEERFDNNEYFQSASEVCEMFLVPEGQELGGMTGFWDEHQLTGDNVIERPYTNIYPRLTTKSNAYKVHYRVQTIKQGRREDYNQFDLDRDVVTGEDQGGALIERFIDPQDPQLDDDDDDYDFQGNPDARKLDELYQYRIRFIRKFTF